MGTMTHEVSLINSIPQKDQNKKIVQICSPFSMLLLTNEKNLLKHKELLVKPLVNTER